MCLFAHSIRESIFSFSKHKIITMFQRTCKICPKRLRKTLTSIHRFSFSQQHMAGGYDAMQMNVSEQNLLTKFAKEHLQSIDSNKMFTDECLQYGYSQGSHQLREKLLKFFCSQIGDFGNQNKNPTTADNVVLTGGGCISSISMLIHDLTNPGDSFIVVSPYYHRIPSVFKHKFVEMIPTNTVCFLLFFFNCFDAFVFFFCFVSVFFF